MKKTAVVLNWMMLGLFGIALVGLGVQYPGAFVGGSLLLLLPYATALLALKSRPNKVLIGCSICFNGLMVLVSVVYVLLGLEMREAAKALLAPVILLPPLFMNCVVLKWAWSGAHAAEDANNRLPATLETRATPEA
jgi:hypothetical protein